MPLMNRPRSAQYMPASQPQRRAALFRSFGRPSVQSPDCARVCSGPSSERSQSTETPSLSASASWDRPAHFLQ